jgi:hypothetical protein
VGLNGYQRRTKYSGNYPYGQKTQKTTKKFKIHRYIRPCQSSALRKYTPFLAPFHHRHTSRVPISVPNSRQRQLKAKSSHPKEHIYCHAVMESCLEALTGPSRPECGGCQRWIRRGSSARRQAGGRSDRRLGHRYDNCQSVSSSEVQVATYLVWGRAIQRTRMNLKV